MFFLRYFVVNEDIVGQPKARNIAQLTHDFNAHDSRIFTSFDSLHDDAAIRLCEKFSRRRSSQEISKLSQHILSKCHMYSRMGDKANGFSEALMWK